MPGEGRGGGPQRHAALRGVLLWTRGFYRSCTDLRLEGSGSSSLRGRLGEGATRVRGSEPPRTLPRTRTATINPCNLLANRLWNSQLTRRFFQCLQNASASCPRQARGSSNPSGTAFVRSSFATAKKSL